MAQESPGVGRPLEIREAAVALFWRVFLGAEEDVCLDVSVEGARQWATSA